MPTTKRVSFPSLIHLLSRHTSKQQFVIVQFLSHKSFADSSISQAKKSPISALLRGAFITSVASAAAESVAPSQTSLMISQPAPRYSSPLIGIRAAPTSLVPQVFRRANFCAEKYHANITPIGSAIHGIQFSLARSANISKFHRNPQDFVNNLLITTEWSRARGQKLRRRANCLNSVRTKFKFFHYLGHFV